MKRRFPAAPPMSELAPSCVCLASEQLIFSSSQIIFQVNKLLGISSDVAINVDSHTNYKLSFIHFIYIVLMSLLYEIDCIPDRKYPGFSHKNLVNFEK